MISSSRAKIALGLFVSLALSGACTDQATDLVPNRVLDRPTDVALTCVQFDCLDGKCEVTPVSLNQCSNLQNGSCVNDGDGTNTAMVGFMTNSERNELALFRSCDGTLVDLDHDLPGYNFVPAGTLPTTIDASENGCRVVAANAGSCDLTVLDAPAIAAMAFDIDPGREPSSLVGQVVPLRLDPETGDWLPLGARLGEALVVPSATSNGVPVDSADPNACISGQKSSVYVSFPGCDLVAEVDLQDGRIHQSFQVVVDDDGTTRVISTGVSPSCPVDCPAQFPGGVPEGTPPSTPGGVALSPLHLLDRLEAEEGGSPAEEYILYAGGMGNDTLFEIRLSSDKQFKCGAETVGCTADDPDCDCADVLRKELIEAKGIQRVRHTPVMDVGVGNDGQTSEHQFLYVISGDGSTRVVDRDLSEDPDEVGVECDTQIEARDDAVSSSICPPVERPPEGLAPLGRRHFAQGPGIRAAGNDTITDWVFFPTSGSIDVGGESQSEASTLIFPCNVNGVMGVGTTTAGQLVWVHYPEQASTGFEILVEDAADTADKVFLSLDQLDPQQLMTLNTAPHSLIHMGDLAAGQLPTVSNSDVPRSFPSDGEVDESSYLSPGLRLIDWAYARTDTGSSGDSSLSTRLGIANVDALGGDVTDEEDNAVSRVYDADAARIFVRDYLAWTSGEWNLIWEGPIPGTSSSTGVMRCAGCESGDPDDPGCGWEAASCKPQEEGDSRLLDSSAHFCDEGVLAGDKVRIFGCTEDSSCGAGQRCLRDAGSNSDTGICIPESAYEDVAERARLREVCADFISDPCEHVVREFRITRAFQDELYLQALDRRTRAHARLVEDEDGMATEVAEIDASFICTQAQPDGGCELDSECEALISGTEEDEGGTFYACIDGRCQRPCESSDECTLRRLPGPECYNEFIRYEVRAGNAFTVRGYGGADFFTQRVVENPDTGECEELTSTSGISTLLTSRIPLGANLNDLDLPACVDDQIVRPTDPNPCLITTPRGATNTSDDRFHYINYTGEDTGTAVAAVRFANPMLAFTLDLVDLRALGSYIEGDEQVLWPEVAADFRRSRIPDDYTTSFVTQQGYAPSATSVYFNVSNLPVFFPVRVIKGPGDGAQPFIYIVDASGPGSSSGLRGQLVQGQVCLTSSEEFVISDDFDGVR